MKKLVLILMLIISVTGISQEFEVIATIYHAKADQCNSEYWRTASYKKIDTLNPIKHRWIAISRDLETQGLKFGDKVQVSGAGKFDGVWTVQDRMNRRWTNRIDLLVGTDIRYGKWNIKIVKL